MICTCISEAVFQIHSDKARCGRLFQSGGSVGHSQVRGRGYLIQKEWYAFGVLFFDEGQYYHLTSHPNLFE